MQKELLFFFSALGAFNGIFLSFYFIFFAKPRHKSHFYLGLLFLALSVRVGKSVFFYFYDNLMAEFIQIGLLACWMIGPLLFAYVTEAIAVGQNRHSRLRILLALFFAFGILIVFLFPRKQYEVLWVNLWVYVIYAQWAFFVLVSGVILFVHRAKLKTENTSKLFPLWLLSIYIGNFLICTAFNTGHYTSYIVGALCFSFVFYILLLFILFAKKRNELFVLYPPKYRTNKISKKEAIRLSKDLTKLVQDDTIFLNPELSLKDLSDKLHVSPLKISQVLNEYMQTSFSDFINNHRVEWSKQMILQKQNYSLDAIAFDSGFNSKSTFYAAFKKKEGITPAKFRGLNTLC